MSRPCSVLEESRAALRACGITSDRAFDAWVALTAGLAAQQNANEPGGDRWVRLADELIDMYFEHYSPATRGGGHHDQQRSSRWRPSRRSNTTRPWVSPPRSTTGCSRVVDDLSDEDWSRPTDCAGWDVKAMLGHIAGNARAAGGPATSAPVRSAAAAAAAAKTGRLRLDAMTALQVSEHAALTHRPAARTPCTRRRRVAWPRAAPRPQAMRDAPYDPQLPGESGWTIGYLFDIIHTRDPWIHRIDICRAIGREPQLIADHDGRIVADVVADWARRHGQPFTLTLTGPAGGTYIAGRGR